MSQFGYAGKILKVDLPLGDTSVLDTNDYSDRFLGGRGIAAKVYWDEVQPDTEALGEDNHLICMTGPLAGFTGFAGCRWQICGKSPLMEPNSFSYANLGGSWGAWLKYSGYDGLVIRGKADHPTYLLIRNGKVEVKDAAHLWGKTTVETHSMLRKECGKDARVLAIGPSGENIVSFATVMASGNASGSSGFGSVMGSKMLKAVVVQTNEKKWPKASDPEELKTLANKVYELRSKNYENYLHVELNKTRLTSCYGCISGCDRREYEEGGESYKHFCQSSAVYLGAALKYNTADTWEDVNMHANKLCDQFGLDTAVLEPMIGWLERCYKAGILSEKETGLPLSRLGSSEFIEAIVQKVSFREGFGDILADGILKTAKIVGQDSLKFLSAVVSTRGNETQDYDPRFMPVNALIYATEPRRPIQMLHGTALPILRWVNWVDGYKDAFLSSDILKDIARDYWGGLNALDFTSYEGKAEAAKKIQDLGYLKECLITCDLAWPIYQIQHFDDEIGFSTLQSRILKAITGKELNEEELLRTGERIFNLQRAILARQGWGGREGDRILEYFFNEPLESMFFSPECIAPGKDAKEVPQKGNILDRDRFEQMKDEYYSLRGWDVKTGLQTRAKLEELQMGDIARELEKEKLLA
jgi:aldehyde:ferredoxin oxidoreductase